MNQRGSNTTILIIVVLACLVGLLILMVYKSQLSSKITSSSSADYLVIKEWGVRLKLDKAVHDGLYVLGSQTNFSEDNATFSTQSLAEYGDSCAGKVNGITPLGMLLRSKATDDTEQVQHIGDYYYRYITPQAVCANDSPVANQLQSSLLPKFKTSIQSLEATPN